MRKFNIFLAIVAAVLMMSLHSLHAQAGDALVSWTLPVQYEDATPLPMAEIKETVIYYGQTSGGPYTLNVRVPSPGMTTTITGLTKGSWYFVGSVVATNNLESAVSVQVTKTIFGTSRPKAPVVKP